MSLQEALRSYSISEAADVVMVHVQRSSLRNGRLVKLKDRESPHSHPASWVWMLDQSQLALLRQTAHVDVAV